MEGGQQGRGKAKTREYRRRDPAVWSYAKGARARGLTDYDQRKRVGGKREKLESHRMVYQRDGRNEAGRM